MIFLLTLFVNVVAFGHASVTRMVDLTYVLDKDIPYFPDAFEPAYELRSIFHNNTQSLTDSVKSLTHYGTHMDAPVHFWKGGLTIDQIPLNRLVLPAAVIDITRQAEANRDYQVTVVDLLRWEVQSRNSLNGKLVLINSGWGKRWPNRERFTGTPNIDDTQLHFPGLHPTAAQWLVQQRNIPGIGIDTLSLDYGPSRDFEAHKIISRRNIYILENVANLQAIPTSGATVYMMPLKIRGASASPMGMFATFKEKRN